MANCHYKKRRENTKMVHMKTENSIIIVLNALPNYINDKYTQKVLVECVKSVSKSACVHNS